MRTRFWMWLAWALPRKLVYQCGNRLGAKASTGTYSSKRYPELTFFEVMKDWNE